MKCHFRTLFATIYGPKNPTLAILKCSLKNVDIDHKRGVWPNLIRSL